MNNNLSFEEAMTLLDETVKRLEGGSMTLDESIGAFEEAVGLVKLCNSKLESAEQKVRILTEGADGIITDMPFESINEN